jgi:hypothetical protein
VTPFGSHPVDTELRTYIQDVRDGLEEKAQAERCDWNGTILVHPVRDVKGRPLARGLAYSNGTMSLRADLLDALREMWHRPDVPGPGAGLRRQQIAVHVVRHELIHFLVPRGQRYYQGLQPYRHFAGVALEEGPTEAAAQNHAEVCADRVESRSPGATDIRNARMYPELTPAARELAAYVGRLQGESAQTVIDALARETARGKWERLPQLVLRARGLWDRIPEQHRPLCERAVRETVWNELSFNRNWAERDSNNQVRTGDPGVRSRIMGRQLVAVVERRRLAIEYQYGTPSRPEVPWQVAAANHEQALATAAARDAAASSAPDAREAASEWLSTAGRQRADAIAAKNRAQDSAEVRELQVEADAPAAGGSVRAAPQAVSPPRAYPPRSGHRRSRGLRDHGLER